MRTRPRWSVFSIRRINARSLTSGSTTTRFAFWEKRNKEVCDWERGKSIRRGIMPRIELLSILAGNLAGMALRDVSLWILSVERRKRLWMWWSLRHADTRRLWRVPASVRMMWWKRFATRWTDCCCVWFKSIWIVCWPKLWNSSFLSNPEIVQLH